MDDDDAKIPAHYAADVARFYEAHARWLSGHACLRTQRDRELAAARELAADLVQDTFEAAAHDWCNLAQARSSATAGLASDHAVTKGNQQFPAPGGVTSPGGRPFRDLHAVSLPYVQCQQSGHAGGVHGVVLTRTSRRALCPTRPG